MNDDTTRRVARPAPRPSAPPAPGLTAHGVSECGPVRKGNEDAFSYDLDTGLFVVADGMGGHAAGEIASRLAVEAIAGYIARSADDDDLTWPFGMDPALSHAANRLRTALMLAHQRVIRAASSHESYHGMGTTVVAVLFTPSRLVVAHAGDSRVYQQLDGRLTALTRDDSLLAAMGEAALAAQEGLVQHPLRNVVTNVLGGEDQLDVHVSEHARAAGMRLLLCSDGVHGTIDDAHIARILGGDGDPRQWAERLVADALAAGGRDNATALLIVDGTGA